MSYFNEVGLIDENGNVINPAPQPFQKTSFFPNPASRDNGTGIPFIEVDSRMATRSTGLTDEGSFRDCFNGTSITTNLTGTVSVTNGSAIVTGVGTLFTTEVNTARYFKLTTDSETLYLLVDSVDSDTQLTLVSNYAGATASGTGQVSYWQTTQSSGATVTVGSSLVNINMPVTSGAIGSIWRNGDYGPFKLSFYYNVDNRRANQDVYIGFSQNNTVTANGPKVLLKLTGTNNTLVDFITSSGDGNEETTTSIVLPNISPTSTYSHYEIDVNDTACKLSVNGVELVVHDIVIPTSYEGMGYGIYIVNTGVVAGATILSNHFVLFKNYNTLEISTSNANEPIKVTSKDDNIPTYSAVIRNLTFANTATCVVSISGSSTKVIEVREFEAYLTSSGAATQIDVSIIKRSTLNTGGTSTTPTSVSYDSNDAPATAVLKSYTANPTTLGTLVGSIVTHTTEVGLSTAGTPPTPFEEEFGREKKKAPTIRGVNELIELNFNASTVSATRNADIYIEWTERPVE